ncbi:MAG: 4a-hydroxytetrahydrobiopterin dehydratase [Myxococcales bacterium]|jgi:4a-hydroxytetrahydrobiopterin dehydratase|nr:4a-hydroxytetrahydrobiopterin dehydratase [Myxococcales bacterium]
MPRPAKLPKEQVDSWVAAHPPWAADGEASLSRTYTFPSFSAALGFVVRVGLLAERRDHHPDIDLRWGRVQLTWATHDAGGITALDVELAGASDDLYDGAKE